MKDFLLSFGGTVISMSLIIFFLLILSRFLKKRFTAACRYAVWVLVVVRLAIPCGGLFSPSAINIYIPGSENREKTIYQIDSIPETEQVPMASITFSPEEPEIVVPGVTGVPVMPNIPAIPAVSQHDAEGNVQGDIDLNAPTVDKEGGDEESIISPSFPVQNDIEEEKTESKKTSDDWFRIVFFAWFVGALSFFVFNIARYWLFSAKLEKKLIVPDEGLAGKYKKVCARLGLRSFPKLFVSDMVSSPLHYGFFNKKIVVPMDLNEIFVENVFSHELTHYKRKDLWVKLVSLVAVSLNWFNPLAYMAVKMLNDEMELSCDECVVKGVDEEQRLIYSQALLETAGKCRKGHIGLTTRFDPKESKVKARIMNVLDMNSKRKGVLIILGVLIVCAVAGFIIGFSVKENGDVHSKENDNNVWHGEWSECAVDLSVKLNEYGKNYREFGYDYMKICGESTFLLAKEQSERFVIYHKGKAFVIEAEIPYTLQTPCDLKLVDINSDGAKEAVLYNREDGVYLIRLEWERALLKKLDTSDFVIGYFKRYFSYLYSESSKVLNYFDNGKKIGEVDLSEVVKSRGAEFSDFEFGEKVYFSFADERMDVSVYLTPRYSDGSSSDAEFNLELKAFINYENIEEPIIKSIIPSSKLEVDKPSAQHDYGADTNYVKIYDANNVIYSVILYGKKSGEGFVLSVNGMNYNVPVKWNSTQPLKLVFNDKYHEKGKYSLLLYENIETFRMYTIQTNTDDNTVEIESLGFADLLSMIDARFSYEYDKETKVITYYSDKKFNCSEHLGKLVEKFGSDFSEFEYRLGNWSVGLYSFDGCLELFPKLENGKIIEEGYSVALKLNIYPDNVGDNVFCINPVEIATKLNENYEISDILSLVQSAAVPDGGDFYKKYLTEEEKYVLLNSGFEDGTKLLGKYGGKSMLYFVNEHDYLYIDKPWCSKTGMVFFKKTKYDLDRDGENELILGYGDGVFLYDKINGEYRVFTYTSEQALGFYKNHFSYSWDETSKQLTIYNDGTLVERISYGNKMENADAFAGIGEPSFSFDMYGEYSRDTSLECNISSYAKYKDGYTVENVSISALVKLKYDSTKGIYAEKINDMYALLDLRDAGVHNQIFYSNNPDWIIRSDEEYRLYVEGKNGKKFIFVNLIHLHYSTWCGESYVPKDGEQVIVWGLFSEYAPRLYVFEDGTRAIITYREANTANGFKYVDRAVIIDLSTGRILFDGGMNERAMFDAHGISENTRKKYQFLSQIGPPLYDHSFEIKVTSDGLLRFENSIISHDGNMTLRGYVDYNISSWTCSEYIITETAVK